MIELWRQAVALCKQHWSTIRKVITVGFIVLIMSLLAVAITKIEWADVFVAMNQLAGKPLWIAAGVTALSYLTYSSYDLLGRWYTEHDLAWWRALMVGGISYAFTMNMGAPVGGLGMRLRLYAKQGLQSAVIMRIVGLAITSNWIGYLILGGAIFSLGYVKLPENWDLGTGALRVIGALMLLAAGAYLVLCAVSRTRSWNLRGHEIELPTIKLALIQVTLSMINWALMGLVVYVLMQQKVDYPMVLGTLLISAIAGVITHIPGGIGVIESVFIALASSSAIPQSEVLAALLVYRAVYYIGPLLLAAAWYLAAEAKMERRDPQEGVAAGGDFPSTK